MKPMNQEITDGERNAMKTLLRKLCEFGCTMGIENSGYSYYIAGSGITKRMGADGLIDHLVKPHDLAHQVELDK